MIVTLAVYSKEQETALALLRWINELGGGAFHTLVLATTPLTNAHPLIEEAGRGWGTVEHFVINTNQEELPWPQGNNANFLAVCKYMNERGRPFFFLESDVLPLAPGWLEKLEREYQMAGKPFMGEVHAMIDPANGKHIEGTDHMNGSGVYPPGVLSYLPTLPYITTEPWDVQLRFEMMSLVDKERGGFKPGSGPMGRIPICHATKAICFCWRTRNYRWEGGRFAYDTDGPAHHRELNLSTHILHHGCKDGSLMALMRAHLHGPHGPHEPQKPAAVQPAATPPANPPSEPFDPTRGKSVVVREVMRIDAPPFDAAENKISRIMEILSLDREQAVAFILAAAESKSPPPRLPAAAFRSTPRNVARKKRVQKPAAGKPVATPAAVPPAEPPASTEPATAAT